MVFLIRQQKGQRIAWRTRLEFFVKFMSRNSIFGKNNQKLPRFTALKIRKLFNVFSIQSYSVFSNPLQGRKKNILSAFQNSERSRQTRKMKRTESCADDWSKICWRGRIVYDLPYRLSYIIGLYRCYMLSLSLSQLAQLRTLHAYTVKQARNLKVEIFRRTLYTVVCEKHSRKSKPSTHF